MKVSDYKISEFLKNNPDAESIPVNEIKEEEEEAPMENQITLEEAMKQISSLDEKINKLTETIDKLHETSDDKKDETSAEMLKSLTEEVKSLKEETQLKAQAEAVMPQEQTADDIIRKFITGGK